MRVIIDRPGFAHFLDLAMTQPRSYGQADYQVLTRLFELLRDVAWHARPEHRLPLLNQLSRLRATAHDQDLDEVELAQLDATDRSVLDVLARTSRA